MNGLLLVVGAIFLINVVVGVKRGFIKIVASLAVTIATIILVMFLSPYVSDAILKFTPIEKIVQEKCIELFVGEEQAEELEEKQDIFAQIELTRDQQIALIEQAPLPDMFRQMLLDNNHNEIYESLGVTSFGQYICKYLAKLIADILAFLLTFIVITIIARIVLLVLGVIGKLPVIGGVNRIAGGALGLVTGLLIVWVLFVVITLLYHTDLAATCLEQIEASPILKFLYDKNILMNYIAGL